MIHPNLKAIPVPIVWASCEIALKPLRHFVVRENTPNCQQLAKKMSTNSWGRATRFLPLPHFNNIAAHLRVRGAVHEADKRTHITLVSLQFNLETVS
jgi:hypothetical protein